MSGEIRLIAGTSHPHLAAEIADAFGRLDAVAWLRQHAGEGQGWDGWLDGGCSAHVILGDH